MSSTCFAAENELQSCVPLAERLGQRDPSKLRSFSWEPGTISLVHILLCCPGIWP